MHFILILDTVKYCIKRLIETDDVKNLPVKGRPRILKEQSESKLIDFINKNNKKTYNYIKKKTGFKGTRRSLNNYALRNQIRMLSRTF